jgi:hypothetical protein
MEHEIILHRDRVLSCYFSGRDWDENDEFTLKRKLVLNRIELLPQYPYVIEDEWEVIDNRNEFGRGDLVFTDSIGGFAVVEVKWIDLEPGTRTGTTKRASNRKKRRKVEEQAIEYATNYSAKLNTDKFIIVKSIEAFYFTNESDRPIGVKDILT